MTEIELMEEFASNLYYIMKQDDISLTELSKRSNLAKGTISRYLKAQRMPTLKSIVNICYALECEYDDLLPFVTSSVK